MMSSIVLRKCCRRCCLFLTILLNISLVLSIKSSSELNLEVSAADMGHNYQLGQQLSGGSARMRFTRDSYSELDDDYLQHPISQNVERLIKFTNNSIDEQAKISFVELLTGNEKANETTMAENVDEKTKNKKKRKKLEFNQKISSRQVVDEQIEHFKMRVSYEGDLKNGREIRLLMMQNESTILLALTTGNKYYYWEFGQSASALIIFCMIVVGNFSILHRLKSCHRRRSNVNYFIVQLAIADLFVGFFSISLDSILRLKKAFTYGPLACRAIKYISVLFIYSSTYLLVALSFDRWEAVVKPLAFTRNRSRGHYLVSGAWLLALVSAAPVTLCTTIKEVQGLPQCWIDLDNHGWKLYMVYLTCSLLIVPAFVIAICYTHIVYTIWSKGRQVARQQKQRKQRKKSATANARKASQFDPTNNSNSNSNSNNGQQMDLSLGSDKLNVKRDAPCVVGSTTHSSAATIISLGRDNRVNPGAAKAINTIHELEREPANDNDDEEDEEEEEEEEEEDTEVNSQETGDEYVSSGAEDEEEGSDYCVGAAKRKNRNSIDGAKRVDEISGINGLKNGSSDSKRLDDLNWIAMETEAKLDAESEFESRIKVIDSTRNDNNAYNVSRIGINDWRKGELETSKDFPSQTTSTPAKSKPKDSTSRAKGVRSRNNYASQQHGSGVIPKARIKTIKMTLVIVAAFILCWAPFYIINLCAVFGLMKSDTIYSNALRTLTQSLAHLNSAVNPIIFWLFSSKRTSSTTSANTAQSNDSRNRWAGEMCQSTLWSRIKRVFCCLFANSRGGENSSGSGMFETTGSSAFNLRGSSIRMSYLSNRKATLTTTTVAPAILQQPA